MQQQTQQTMDTKKLSEVAIIFIGISLFVFVLQAFESFLRPLAIAVLLSFLFTPLFKLSKKDRVKIISKISLVAVIVLAFLVAISASSISGITKLQADERFEGNALEYLISSVNISVFGREITIEKYVDLERVQEFIRSVAGYLVSSLTEFASELFLVILFLVFILPGKKVWLDKVRKKPRENKHTITLITDLEQGISGYLKSKTIISLGTAGASFIIMLLLGIDHAFLFATMMFIFNYVPTFGDYISFAVILGVQVFTIGIGFKFFILLALLIGVQIVFSNFIEPRFAGKTLQISPLIVLISLLFWGVVWGIGGMLFAVPLTVAIKVLLKHYKATNDISKLIE